MDNHAILVTWKSSDCCMTQSNRVMVNFFKLFGKFLTLAMVIISAKNTVILPNFLVWKFCGTAQFSHSFERIARNYAETVPFHKNSTPGNEVKLRYF